MSDFRAGSQIGGYVLEQRLGGGSFGEVWRGHEVATGRAVAVKVLTGMLSSPDTAGMRAEVETLAAAAASRSENIVHVLGGGSDPVPYIVMEYIEGSDLSALLADGRKLDVERTIDVGIAISSALGALYEAGIVHRDIKPANVMVDNQGNIKLADFGIAKIVGYETMTMTGQAAMTMAYAAPEVWDDDSPFGRPSHRSDLYAMGILLFQCLTGETPFRGNYGALYRQHTERPPDLNELPSEVPPSLRALIRSCLEKKQTDRPASSAECIAILGRARAELAENHQRPAAAEPTKFGSWIKDAPHPTQPWAWLSHHETSNDKATVEVHFADNLEYGEALRRAVNASPQLTAYGAERLLQTNRLLLRPGEAWTSPPPGDYEFWVARQEKDQTAVALVTLPVLGAATMMYSSLISAGVSAGVTIAPTAEDFAVLADGSLQVKRPGLHQTNADAQDVALTRLRALPLDATARDVMANAATFQALVTMAQNLGHSAAGGQDTMIHAQDTVIAGGDTVIGLPRTPINTPGQTCASCNEPLQPNDRWCFSCGHPVGQPAPTPAVASTEIYRTSGVAAPAAAIPSADDDAQAAQTSIFRNGAATGALQLELSSLSAKGASGDYEVRLYNPGLRAVTVNLQAYDMEDKLAYNLPAQVMLAEGAYERLNLHVEPRKRRLLGLKKTTPFTVAASGSGGGGFDVPLTAEGEFDDMPSIAPLVAGGAAAVAVAVLAFALMSGGGGDDNNNGSKSAKSADKPNNAAAMADFTPIATPSLATPLAVEIPPTPTPIPPPTSTPEPPPPPTATPVPPPPPSGGGGAGAGTGSGGTGTGTGGGGTIPIVPIQPVIPTPIPPPPPTPVPVVTPVRISSISCTSSRGTATLSSVAPASSQTAQLTAAANETITCTANVTGDYTSLAWNSPGKTGSGPTFSTSLGATRAGGPPFTINFQVNWNGNPAIANFAVTVR